MTTPAANPNTSGEICSGLESFPDPRKTSPYFDGQEARKRGEGLYMCPWEMDTAPGRLWIKGWHRDPNNSLTVSPDAKRDANTSGGIGSP